MTDGWIERQRKQVLEDYRQLPKWLQKANVREPGQEQPAQEASGERSDVKQSGEKSASK